MAKKWNPFWGIEELELAQKAVADKGMSVRKASQTFGIPRTTLRDHVKCRVRAASGESPRPLSKGRKTLLDPKHEAELKTHVLTMSSIFYGITMTDFRRLAYEVAERTGANHQFDTSAKMAGLKWTRLFLKRHLDISLRSPEPTSIGRLAGFRQSEVKVFFDNLEGLIQKHKYTPSRVFNVDETAVSTVVDPPKILSRKGAKRVGVVTSAERGQNTTAVICCNAAGGFIPP